MSATFTRRARYLTFAGLATLALGTVAQLAVSPAAVSADTYTVPLHNTSTEDVADCPGSPAQYGWHFIVPGNDAVFVSLTVTFEDAGTITITDFGPPSDKHAYVYTPTADTLLSGTATISGGDEKFFVLSHTCNGGGTETPSPTPSATVSPSESVSPSSTPSETVSETPSATVSPTVVESESPSSTPSETVSETPSATVSATVIESESPSASPSESATVLPTVITQTPSETTEAPSTSPSVKGVKTVRTPAVSGSGLPTTGTPIPVALLLLLGFGLVGAGVVATVAGEPRAAGTAGAKHRR
jgi:hypothetical protein